MPSNENLIKKEWRVDIIPLIIAQQIIKKYHYAHGTSNSATYRHGLYCIDNPIRWMGAIIWIPPTKGAAIASYDGDWKKVLSLSRLVVVPNAPKNSASFLIGESIKRIKMDGKYKCLITYADEWRGHQGKIYKATNWEYLGITTPERIFVEPISGRMVARKAGPRTRTMADMESLGYKMIGRYAKHKFRIILK